MILRRNLGLAALLATGIGLLPATLCAQDSIQRGGVLRIAMDIEPASLDPIMGNGLNSDPNIYNQIYDKLFVLDAEGKLQPRLAESWTFSPDNRSITFRLRPGVKFHDGTPFDAEAVRFNIERVAAPNSKAPAATFVSDVASVDVLDSLTARVNLKQPSGAVIAGLAVQSGMMISPAALKARGADFARNPVGTGPFRFKEWVGGDRIVVERNPDYFRPGADGKPLPYLDGITTRFIKNSAVKLVELRSGNVDLGDSIQVKDFDKVDQSPELDLVQHPQGNHLYLTFNVTAAPFDNIDLRKAISHGINRPAVEKIVSRGFGAVTATYWGPSEWVHDPSLKGDNYDPDLARKLYAKSGHKGPLTLSVIQRDPDTQIAQIIQAQLKAAGIELRVEVLERQAWLDKVLGYKFEIGMLRGQTPRPDPDITFSAHYARDANNNYSGIKDEALFDAVALGRASLDRDERKKHYVRAQQILLDKTYYSFLFTTPIKDVKRKEVRNLRREFGSQWLLDETWIARR